MPKIDTIEELMLVLDERPQWLEALRMRLLTRELIELPRRFAEFAASVDQNFAQAERRMDGMEQTIGGTGKRIDGMEQTIGGMGKRIDGMEQTIGGMGKRIDGMEQTIGGMGKRMDGMEQTIGGMGKRMDGMERTMGEMNERMDSFATKDQQQKIVDSVGNLKGFMAERPARRDAYAIAVDMGFKTARRLTPEETVDLARSPALARLPRGERLSFRKADVLIEAVDEAGETSYVAVEASYTADERDTARALRNADLLRRATGRPARAAVACVHADDRVRSAAESGEVYCHELPDYRDSADFE